MKGVQNMISPLSYSKLLEENPARKEVSINKSVTIIRQPVFKSF